MLLLDLWNVFRPKQSKIVAQNAPCVLRIDDVVYKTSLGSNHWICEFGSILGYAFVHIVLFKQWQR